MQLSYSRWASFGVTCLPDNVGRLIGRPVNGEIRDAGLHVVEWDGRDRHGIPIASGLYYYRLNSGKLTASKKVVLLR